MTSILQGRFRRCSFWIKEKGSVAMEFALTLPIWITIVIGTCDAAFLMLVSQRVDRIAYSVSDIVTQSESVSGADLVNTMTAAGELMLPFTFGAKGIVYVSSVFRASGSTVAKILWRCKGGGSLSKPSLLGTVGGVPNLPNSMTLNSNDNVIVTEVYYHFKPMFVDVGVLSEQDIYRESVYKPRLSQLTTAPVAVGGLTCEYP